MAQYARSARTLAATIVAALVVAIIPAVPRIQAAAAVAPGGSERVSVTTDGSQAENWWTDGGGPAVSATGRFVAFSTRAALDPVDEINEVYGESDIYLRDRQTPGRTLLISRGAGGAEPADSDSRSPAVSATGRFVAFDTYATNIPGVPNRSGQSVIAVCDRDPDGDGVFDEPSPGGGPDYRFVQVGRTSDGEPVPDNAWPSISADGRTVAWVTTDPASEGWQLMSLVARFDVDEAGRLLPPPESAYRRLNTLENYTPPGMATPVRVSADGSHVAFTGSICEPDCASRRLAVFVTSLVDDRTDRLDVDAAGRPIGADAYAAAISGDGRVVAFTMDEGTNVEAGPFRVVVVDRDPDGDRVLWPVAGEPVTQRVVSRTNAGALGEGETPALSGDGRYVAFVTRTPGIHNGIDRSSVESQVVVRDLVVDREREAANLPGLPGELASPGITTDCVPDVGTGTCGANGPSSTPVLSAAGEVVAFESTAPDVVPGDTNSTSDAFVRVFRPALRADPPAFPAAVTGTATTSTAVLQHVGFGPLRIGTISVIGPNAKDFALSTVDTCRDVVLHETGSCLVALTFTPDALGTRQAALVVGTDAGPITIPLTGEGVAARPVVPQGGDGLQVSPAELVFPGERTALSASAPAVLTVSNADVTPITVSGVTLTSGPRLLPQDFRITRNTCTGPTLQPGASCQVLVTHSPLGSGERLGALVVDADRPHLVGLRARGTAATAQANPGVVAAGRVVDIVGTGFPTRRPVTIALPGSTTVTVSTGASGGFRVPYLVLDHSVIGNVTIRVTAPGTELEATASLLVVPGTYQPPTFLGRR